MAGQGKTGLREGGPRFSHHRHPLDRYVADIKRLNCVEIAKLMEQSDGGEIRICGIVSALKEITTKKGDRMGFVTLEDLTGSVEVTVFSDIYLTAAQPLEERRSPDY